MTHQPTVTKNYKNTQSEFDSNLGSCDVSVAPRAVRLSTSPGTQLLLLVKGNSDVPLFFSFLKLPPLRMQAFQKLQPGSTVWSEDETFYSDLHLPSQREQIFLQQTTATLTVVLEIFSYIYFHVRYGVTRWSRIGK